jgi:hypothetical protein
MAAPSLHTPVIVVLLAATQAQCPIAPTAAAEELAAAQLDLAVVHRSALLTDDVPVRRPIKELRPTIPMTAEVSKSTQGMTESLQALSIDICTHPPVMCTFSRFSLCWPASITRILRFESSASRPATTQPAVPPL